MRHFLIVGLLLASATALHAQVGYLPSQSPFQEIERGGFTEVFGGRVFGTGGLLQLGPRNGTSIGVRYLIRAKNTLAFSFGFWTAGLERTVIDPDDSIAVRNKGLTPQRMIAGEIGVQLNLTGGKTWHHLAPYGGVSFGLVHGQASPATDTSGYSFGSKLYFAPTLGSRLFLGQRLYAKLEIRGVFWSLTYPPSYSDEPAKQPGTPTHSNAVNTTGVTSQYTLTPEIRFGLGIAW